ncbi:MAG: Phenolphthiocerol synthesis polyketide synthase type I Pks15/1 [Candidatus Lokiarchaeum sp. GC14_75]|nr:MAG: Phenolphthiocerol synthesis polyketide synthase type I Pks15/1 [Candidatus Lokiarchaeum sp. GC14_75]
MKKKQEILKLIKNKIPVWGYSPRGINNPSLSIKISQLGGVGLIDFEDVNSDQCQIVLERLSSTLSTNDLWGIRISSQELLEELIFHNHVPIIICTFSPDSQNIKKMKENSKLLVSEVCYLEEAFDKSNWADLYLVKGNEAGGLVGTKSTFILIQEFQKAGFSFVIQGGFGVYNICAAFIGGALGVVLESQLFLFPECPINPEFKDYIKSIEENDFYLLTETLRYNYRLIGKLANKSIRSVKEIEFQEFNNLKEEYDNKFGALKSKYLSEIHNLEVKKKFFSDTNPKHSWLPSDHGICFASYILKKFNNLETFLNSLLNIIQSQFEKAKEHWPFVKSSKFAQQLNITYPIIQGPMANISDQISFAKEIAANGALPILALGGLMGYEADQLLSKFAASNKLSVNSCGCGIIGLEVVKERRDQQLKSISKYGPNITLIAAGTTDLGAQVKKTGNTILIHTPALSMFRDALKKRLDFMILEGKECGGHFGILSSFILWESILEYLDVSRVEISKKINIIFAGGIINETSTAMLAGIIGAHLDIINPGIQMGTAYLLSEEIVRTQALSPVYQDLLLNYSSTKVIGTTVNARARVLPTTFALDTIKNEFLRKDQGITISKRKEMYEYDNLGALRIASRAEVWNEEHVQGSDSTQFIPTSYKNQLAKGAFMTGESISLQNTLRSIPQIHYDIIEGGLNTLKSISNHIFKKTLGPKSMIKSIETKELKPTENKIAIVGIGGIFPDAQNIPEFWENIVNRKYSIIEVPDNRWNKNIFYSEDHSIPEKTYSKVGGFIKDFKFKSIKYRIPPKMAERMDMVQKWAITTAEEALKDAGYPTDGKSRLPIAVIVGNSSGGDAQRLSNKRVIFNEVEYRINEASSQKILNKEQKDKLIDYLKKTIVDPIPQINEDTMPGELSNIIAGRVANVFNLTGKSMTIDAACASSLAAIDTAVNSLIMRDYDVVLAGGSDSSMDPQTYIKFSKIGALSEDGSYPFDSRANGFIMGEGAGFMVLKRIEDAIRDKNKIYAIVSGYGGSSDGKGKGITAPNPEGQRLAIERAFKASKIEPNDIQYLECHGTSTIVGDATELKVLQNFFSGRTSEDKLAIGSIKSQIGHLKSAAGIAGILKTVLALHHKVIPPSINYETPNPNIDWDASPYYVNVMPKNWVSPANGIRRASVSSFGFGGTNYNVILEEFKTPSSYVVSSLSPEYQISSRRSSDDLCFLFSGQGSQYIGMAKEIYQNYQVVRDTLDNANTICKEFGDFDLLEIIFGSPDLTDEENSDRLKQTQYTQPAIYSVEMALKNLFNSKDIKPGIVGGHSLGEFAALATAGVLNFEDALKVVIMRGKAMSILPPGVQTGMAAIFTSSDIVEKTLQEISNEDVTISNYNSYSQTVISGENSAVDSSVKFFSEKGIRAIKLNVSNAFHSKFVAHAEDRLKEFLKSIEFRAPQIPVFSNVTGKIYPNNPDEIKSILLKQITSPVKWVDEILNIYIHGGRKFLEIGPNRALFYFAKDILKKNKDTDINFTLSPKSPEKEHIEKILQKFEEMPSLEPKKMSSTVSPTITNLQSNTATALSRASTKLDTDLLSSIDNLKEIKQLPFFNEFIEEQKELLSTMILKGISKYITKYQPIIKNKIDLTKSKRVMITGVGLGLPGRNRKVFDDKNIEDILHGTNLIETVDIEYQEQLFQKNIIRLEKAPNGNAKFVPVDDISKVISLAGQLGDFNPTEDFLLDSKSLNALDITFQLAICAGYEALKDAGIPLIRSSIKTSTGKTLAGDWVLPEELQDETGIIFASAFPGFDNLAQDISSANEIDQKRMPEEDAKTFNRAFLFRVLSMGHSQFAQLIKAKGPNTSINAACASTPQAIGIAEDWIRTGRCKRVIVITADNVTSKNLFQWIGAGFLASGAATVQSRWEDAVLPFGEGRNGIILGAGASAFVIEQESEAKARGVKPIVEILGSYFANSAFHGSRLDRVHISDKLDEFVSEMEKRHGITKDELASEGMFVSHETYSPARGGSAESELIALEKTFGKKAFDMMIINTKGYTGHAMGAGIEEAVAIKSMEKGLIPPIANLNRIDPNYLKFNFSKGSSERKKYALRFAAGFGSQLAFVLFRLVSYDNRLGKIEYERWLQKIGGGGKCLFNDGRVLKMTTARIKPVQTTAVSLKSKETIQRSEIIETNDIVNEIKQIIALKTGYDPVDIENTYDLEEDLGIDTVKQAEIFGEIREKWNIEADDSINFADYRTINEIISLLDKLGISTSLAKTSQISQEASSFPTSTIKNELKQIIALKTGYDQEDIEDTFDLEEDLGIDTVKQAEIFGEIREKWNLEADDSINFADYRNINDIVSLVEKLGISTSPAKTYQMSQETSSFPRNIIKNEIKQIIALKTGYDPEDIEDIYDLEEDLGIDTVKQAEIFGEIREKWNIEADDSINFADYRNIKDIVSLVEKLIDPVTDGIDITKPVPIESTETNLVQNFVKKVIAEKTGYDVSDIEDNYDLEEDLGIDTVKQAEIFGELREYYKIEASIEINIAEIRTPAEITQFVKHFLVDKPNYVELKSEGTIDEGQLVAKSEEDEEEIFISKIIPSRVFRLNRLKHDSKLKNLDTLVLNINSGLSNFPGLIDEFLKIGLKPQTFDLKSDTNIVKILEKKDTESLFEKDFKTLILIIPNKKQYSINDSLTFFSSLFLIFQSLNLSVIKKIYAISPESYFGWDQDANPLSSSIGAYIKTINREFQIPVKHIYSKDSEEILQEFLAWDNLEEIAYKDSIRYTLLRERLKPISELNRSSITGDDVLLATGGAQGITFICIDDLTNYVKPELILLGLAPIDNSLYEYLDKTPQMLEVKKEELKNLLKANNEKVTPVMIKRDWKNFLDQLETLQNIDNLRKKGLSVQYYDVDVTDDKKMEDVFKQIQEKTKKPISIVVHGAGIEISKSFLKKKINVARKVVEVKIKGFINLLKHLPLQELKYIIAFSSVAGRYGNQGQIDYAFANAYLSRLAWDYTQRKTSFLTINWTAWADIGMATQGSTLQILTQAGVVPIPAKIGVKMFSKLVLNRFEGEYVVGGKLGIFEEKLNVEEVIDKSVYPMLTKIDYQSDFIIGSNTLNSEFDTYLLDHQIQGRPVFPGVMVLETFAEFYNRVFGKPLTSISNISFHTALKVPERKSIDVKVKLDKSNNKISFFSRTYPSILKGKPLIKEHFTGQFINSKRKLKWKKRTIIESLVPLLNKSEIYELFFHGEKFQVLKEIVQLERGKIIVKTDIPSGPLTASKSKGNDADHFQLDPLTLESVFQAAALFDIIINNHFSLPSKISNLEILSKKKPKYIDVKFLKEDEAESYYNAVILSEDQEIIAKFNNLVLIHAPISVKISDKLSNYFQTLQEYYILKNNNQSKNIEILPIDQIKQMYQKNPQCISNYLTENEIESSKKFRNEKRKIEYFSGIIAAKACYLNYLKSSDNGSLHDIEIHKDDKGKPFYYSNIDMKKIPLNLSISHSHDFSVAMTSKKLVGVDLELIESRAPSFYKEIFTEAERKLISESAELGTLYWTAKEAFSKAIGEGFHINFLDVQLKFNEKQKKFSVKYNNDVSLLPRKLQNLNLKSESSNKYVLSYCEI